MKELTDQELIAKHLNGDRDAFALLVKRHLRSVYFFCSRLVGAEDANDAAQETFIKVWKNLKKFDDKKSFKVWLYRIARNTCLDQLKKKKSVVFSDLKKEDDESSFEEGLADERKGADEILVDEERKSEIFAAVRRLSIIYQEVFDLYYQEQLTFQEIADVTGTSINTVKSRHRRGLNELRSFLTS